MGGKDSSPSVTCLQVRFQGKEKSSLFNNMYVRRNKRDLFIFIDERAWYYGKLYLLLRSYTVWKMAESTVFSYLDPVNRKTHPGYKPANPADIQTYQADRRI